MSKRFKQMLFMILIMLFFSFYSKINVQADTYKYSNKPINIVLAIPQIPSTMLPKLTTFKTYRIIVTSDKLSIRKNPSSTGKKIGTYEVGRVVEVIGKSGMFLKTPHGYITKTYTKIITGMYLTVPKDTSLVNSATNKMDDRMVVPGKYYFIVGSKANLILVKVGRITGYLKQDSISTLSDMDKSKVTIGWDYVNKMSSNIKNTETLDSYVNTKASKLGLDVLSPTWFDVTGIVSNPATININSIADKNYVAIAHKNGYEVWPRLCEMDKNRATIEFNDPKVRTRIISQISKLAVEYDVDGINVDYEALGIANMDGFTSFMKELYTELAGFQLKVSVDVTKYSKTSSLYSLCYDRPSLAKYCDYLILMGYDEHVTSSKEPGSVGSYDWVEESISQMLSQGVPNKKIILGIPFYLRDYGVISNDAIVFNQPGKIYSIPLAVDNNKLAAPPGVAVFKFISSDESWYNIDYNGIQGYINKKDGTFIKGSYEPITTDSSIIVTTDGGVISTTGQAIRNTTPGGIEITLPYDAVVTNNNIIIYKNKYEVTTNKLADASAKDYYKYLATQGAWYKVEYKGINGYVPKSQVAFLKADSRTIGSNSVSMQSALDTIKKYGGSIIKDLKARQSVGVYYKDGFKHLIWLENTESMSWRMDLANKYKLPGVAVWSLNWKPTIGIWDVIKKKLK